MSRITSIQVYPASGDRPLWAIGNLTEPLWVVVDIAAAGIGLSWFAVRQGDTTLRSRMISGEHQIFRFDLGEGVDLANGNQLTIQLGDEAHSVELAHVDLQAAFNSMKEESLSSLPPASISTNEPFRFSVVHGIAKADVALEPEIIEFEPEDVAYIIRPTGDDSRLLGWLKFERPLLEDIKQHAKSKSRIIDVRHALGLRRKVRLSAHCRVVASSVKLDDEHWISFNRVPNPAYRLKHERQFGGRRVQVYASRRFLVDALDDAVLDEAENVMLTAPCEIRVDADGMRCWMPERDVPVWISGSKSLTPWLKSCSSLADKISALHRNNAFTMTGG